MGLDLIFNAICVIYDNNTCLPKGVLHSVYVRRKDQRLVFLMYQGGLVAHLDSIPNGIMMSQQGCSVKPIDVIYGRAVPMYENLALNVVQRLIPRRDTIKLCLQKPGVVYMISPLVLNVVDMILEKATLLSCMLDPIDTPAAHQFVFSDRVCARGHTYRLSERLSECYVRGKDQITCGVIGCDQTIPIRVLEAVKTSLSPSIRTLVESVADQSLLLRSLASPPC